MQTVSQVTFQDETVCLDDTHFIDCTLLRCVLQYSGRELMLERTELRGCRLQLSDAAGRTLSFLQCLGYMGAVEGDWIQSTAGLRPPAARVN